MLIHYRGSGYELMFHCSDEARPANYSTARLFAYLELGMAIPRSGGEKVYVRRPAYYVLARDGGLGQEDIELNKLGAVGENLPTP